MSGGGTGGGAAASSDAGPACAAEPESDEGAAPAKGGRVASGHQCKSQYEGVSRSRKNFCFKLTINGQRVSKTFLTEEEAARARDDLVRLLRALSREILPSLTRALHRSASTASTSRSISPRMRPRRR